MVPEVEKGDHARRFTLLVRWSDTGAVTLDRNVRCDQNLGSPNLDPVAHRGVQHRREWDHIITGSEVLVSHRVT